MPGWIAAKLPRGLAAALIWVAVAAAPPGAGRADSPTPGMLGAGPESGAVLPPVFVSWQGTAGDGTVAGGFEPDPPRPGAPFVVTLEAYLGGSVAGPIDIDLWLRDLAGAAPAAPFERFAADSFADAAWRPMQTVTQAERFDSYAGIGVYPTWVGTLRGELTGGEGRYQLMLRLRATSDAAATDAVVAGPVIAIAAPPGSVPAPAAAPDDAPTAGGSAVPAGSPPAPPDAAAASPFAEAGADWTFAGEAGAPRARVHARLDPAPPAPGVPVTVDLRLLPQEPEAAPAGAVTAAVWFLGIGDHPAARQEIVPRAGIEERGAWTPLRAVAGPGGGQRFVGAVPVPPGRHQLVVLMSDPGGVYDGILVGPVVEMPGG